MARDSQGPLDNVVYGLPNLHLRHSSYSLDLPTLM